jgi:hypothetical protein
LALRTITVGAATWNVWDTVPASDGRVRMAGTRMALGWLTFECGDEKRRLVPIPDGWHNWPEENLADALGKALPVRPRNSLGSHAAPEQPRGLPHTDPPQ